MRKQERGIEFGTEASQSFIFVECETISMVKGME